MPFSAMWSKWVRPSLRKRLPAPTTNRQRFTPALRIASSTWWTSFSFHLTDRIAASWPLSTSANAATRRCSPAFACHAVAGRELGRIARDGGHAYGRGAAPRRGCGCRYCRWRRSGRCSSCRFPHEIAQGGDDVGRRFLRHVVADCADQAPLVGAGEVGGLSVAARARVRRRRCSPCRLIVGTVIVGLAGKRRLDAGAAPGRPARSRSDGDRSGSRRRRSRDCRTSCALVSKVASSKCQFGDHSCHSSRQMSRRFLVRPARPRSVWK